MEATRGEEGPPSRLVLPFLSALIFPTQDAQANPEDPQSSSEGNGDYTWTPTRRASTKKGQVGRGPMKSKKIVPCPTQMKKKCVNGFIMFCRMNRKQYIRWVGILFGHLPPRACCPMLSIHWPLPEPPTNPSSAILSFSISPGPIALVRACRL